MLQRAYEIFWIIFNLLYKDLGCLKRECPNLFPVTWVLRISVCFTPSHLSPSEIFIYSGGISKYCAVELEKYLYIFKLKFFMFIIFTSAVTWIFLEKSNQYIVNVCGITVIYITVSWVLHKMRLMILLTWKMSLKKGMINKPI